MPATDRDVAGLRATTCATSTTTAQSPRRRSTSTAPTPEYYVSEQSYFDYDSDGNLSDDERDEDADGLTNFDEAHGRMTAGYWTGCYAEKPFDVAYAGTDIVDPRHATATACATARTTRTTTTCRTSTR